MLYLFRIQVNGPMTAAAGPVIHAGEAHLADLFFIKFSISICPRNWQNTIYALTYQACVNIFADECGLMASYVFRGISGGKSLVK